MRITGKTIGVMTLLAAGTTLGACGPTADGEIHLLPEAYVGPVVIVYDQADGAPPERNADGWRVYRIPADGILYTQFGTNYGTYPGPPKYYRDRKGERVEVDWLPRQEVASGAHAQRTDIVSFNNSGHVGRQGRCYPHDNPNAYSFRYYVVGPAQRADSLMRLINSGMLEDIRESVETPCP